MFKPPGGDFFGSFVFFPLFSPFFSLVSVFLLDSVVSYICLLTNFFFVSRLHSSGHPKIPYRTKSP